MGTSSNCPVDVELDTFYYRVNPNEVRIHLLTSEGRPHPDASVPIITAHSTQPIRHFTTLVLSSLFAVVSPGTHAWVWNWREGKLLFELVRTSVLLSISMADRSAYYRTPWLSLTSGPKALPSSTIGILCFQDGTGLILQGL